MRWTKGKIHANAWDSDDGHYHIAPHDDGYLLISFANTKPDGEPWRKQFPTLEAAMEYAEVM
jgi:hypothetical protein